MTKMSKDRLAEVLQAGVEHVADKIKDGTVSSTELSFLQKVASANGVDIDYAERRGRGYPYNSPTPMLDADGEAFDFPVKS